MRTLVANEFLKLRTIRSPLLLFGLAQLLIVGGIAGLMVGEDTGAVDRSRSALGHVGLVSLLTLVLGIMAIAGEYRHRTITDTFLTTPRRRRVVGAKLIVYTLTGIGFGVGSAVVATITTAIWLSAKGESLQLGNGDVLRTLAGGIGWDAAFAAIGVGIGALVRNLAGAIAAALAWIALAEGIVGQLLGGLGDWLPFASGVSLDRMSGQTDGLSQGTAAVVLLAYAAIFAVLAITSTLRRDVS